MLDVSDVRPHPQSAIFRLLRVGSLLPSPIFPLLALLSLSAVAAAQTPPANHNAPATAITSVTNAAPLTPSTLSGYVPDDKYKLRTGDKIAFQILEDRDLPKSLVVTDSGE